MSTARSRREPRARVRSPLAGRSLRIAAGILLVCGASAGRAAAPPGAPPRPAIQDLATRLDLRDPFNLGQGTVRIVAFLSPTCSHCIANAHSLQSQVLDKLEGAEIAVHVVWVQVLEHDKREAIAAAAQILHDRRVRHYWDPKRVLNAQLLDAVQFDVQLRLFDVFLLYDGKATWEKRLPRPGFWMHEFRGMTGPKWDGAAFAVQVGKALDGKPLDTPQP